MTAQIPEILIHRGTRYDLCACPLDDYLRRLRKARRPDFVSTTTACWRGYVGTWEIRRGRLCLIALEGVVRTQDGFAEADLATALPWARDGLDAKWVTGRLRCPEGRLLDYVHAAFASHYERDRVLAFDKGRVTGEWVVLNPPDPVVYWIAPDGARICVPDDSDGEDRAVPDPLNGADFGEVYKYWGTVPKGGEADGYLVAAEFIHPPR